MITGKLDFPDDHPMLDHYRYVASITKVQPKISIPGPSCCHFRTAPKDIAPPEYRDPRSAVWRHRKNLCQGRAGLLRRRLPIPSDGRHLLCLSLRSQASRRQGGAGTGPGLSDRPLCLDAARGDQGSPRRHGHCDAHVPGQLPVEHGPPRAPTILLRTRFSTRPASISISWSTTASAPADWSRCACCRKGKKRVLPGFITTKTAELEDIDDLKRKFDLASNYVDINQLGIAPQCGFSSTEEGNEITADDQWRKLELVVRTAEVVWGGVDG